MNNKDIDNWTIKQSRKIRNEFQKNELWTSVIPVGTATKNSKKREDNS